MFKLEKIRLGVGVFSEKCWGEGMASFSGGPIVIY